MWIPGTPIFFPVCYVREFEGSNDIPINALVYDVFPPTLAEFLVLGPKADGGRGQSWDARFGALHDADGDGLQGAAYNGLDPNDNTWDADADGLSDRFELERGAAGVPYSPIQRDTDGDGLTDRQEAQIGTDPAINDTDNDGLRDGDEVRHLRYDSNGNPTSTWEGGWQVIINSSPAKTIWVASDPFNADGDADGTSDLAERQLATGNPAQRVDGQNIPYHPNVANTPPLAVFATTNDINGYLRPGQSFRYTTTVVANTDVAPGVLNITAPTVVGGSPTPLALNFSGSPTATQATQFTVASNAGTQPFSLLSTVNTRLSNTGAAEWVWSTPTSEAGLGSFSGRLARFIAAAPAPDRPDTYRLAGLAATQSSLDGGPGDVWGFNVSSGVPVLLDTDAVGATTTRGSTPPALACNASSVCLAVWEERPAGAGVNSDLLGVLIQPNGTVTTAAFTIASGTADTSGHSNAKVASDGVNFLVAWQRLTVAQDDQYGYIFQTNLMTRLYNGQGTPVTAITTLPSELVETKATNIDSLSGLNGARYKLTQLDLDWLGDRYRLTRWFNSNAVQPADVIVSENGIITSKQRVSWRDVNAAGALIAGSKVVPDVVIAGIPTDVSLTYHPVANQVLLVVAGFDLAFAQNLVAARTFARTGTQTVRAATVSVDTTSNVEAVYYPSVQQYLIGWTAASNNTRFTYKLYDLSLNEVILPTAQQPITWPTAVNTQVGAALACPAISAQPVIDLRFEDLPGTSFFEEDSGYGNYVYCDNGACPAAGISGAPNAPLSDYGVQFDGVNDRLFINRSLADSFTVALWVKSAPGANEDTFLVDQGAEVANGWTFYLGAGALHLLIGTNQYLDSFSPRIDDNQWHFVASTRNRATGAVALYVDGAQVASGTATTNALNAVADLRIGGDRNGARSFKGAIDHLQIFPVAMPQSTIQALYNRTLQSYCMAAGVAASGNTFPWARISLQQQDTRGGRISASGSLPLIIDGRGPETRITSVSAGEILGPDQVIGGEATDNRESGVGKVEVSVNNGPWLAATGAEAWSFSLAGYTGDITLRARATDQVGNVGNPFVLPLRIDTTGPNVTIDPIPGTLKPTKNAAGQWQVRVRGRAEDQLARTKAGSVVVQLTQQSGVGVAQSQQIASGEWDINYLLDASLYDPTSSYTITVRAEDNVGNPSNIATGVVRLDANGPVANLNPIDTAHELITQTLTIGGVVSDTNSIAGIDRLEIAFTPIEQVAALPGDSTSTAAEALLNRTWRAVTLAQRGAGIATTNWSFPIPADLENSYQIDLRGTDMLGNISITASIWRGIIDTTNPRVVMTAAASGASYFDVASNQPLYAIRFVCAAQDRNLDETGFTCPGEGLAEPVRTFDNQPVLQNLFPDLTIRRGLAISYTLWLPTTTPAATMSACDSFGRCAQASTALTASTVPQAVIVNPTTDSFVAASTVMSVTVAAEAGAGLKDVTISLDNTVVQTLSFAQAENVTRVLRTVSMPVANEGLHTLVAQATAWDNASQTTLFPIVFTLDTVAPTVTIDASTLTLADTWQPESGVLRFNGTASDSVGLATVQIREAGAPGANSFADATFGSGTWRVALPVPDPEGRTLNITVRAIDRAGRISELTQNISTDLSAADAPDTSISSGPANPSSDNFATFAFAGSVSAIAFDCQIDDGVYTPCASPTSYNDLSKGSHTFRVRAIDSRGLADLSPAEQTWTVNASALDVNMTSTPSNPTTSRNAQFGFSGNGSSFECSLDSSTFAACSTPHTYSGLANGEHVFQVRARSGDTFGAAARFVWTVNNAAPVATDQTVTTPQDTALAITLTASDEDALVYKVGTPAHGVLVGIPPALTYSPNTGYTGPDSFTFTASDGLVESNLGTITIDVQGGSTANRAPLAVDDGLPSTSEIMAQGRITLTTLLDNDSDPEDTTPADGTCTNCSIIAVGQASQGTVTLAGATVTYLATNRTFVGTDTFTYTASDNDARGALTASAQVAVTVQADAVVGDCNANGTIDAGDLTALGLEIFDGDGNRWYDADGGSVAFSPYGCDANADAVIDAGDLTCTARRIFDTAFVCGAVTAAQAGSATLAVGADLLATPGDAVDVPLVLDTGDQAVAAAAFSLHWAATQLPFDASDANADGIPDAVTLHLPDGLLASATYHTAASRLDVVVLGIGQPFPLLGDGPLATVRLTVPADSTQASTPLTLSTASLGGVEGQSLPLTVRDGAVQLSTQTFRLLLPLVSR